MMKGDFVILGGGLAGLSAAIKLAESGAQPLLIDAGHYPSHKVCGEFLSPDSLPLLQKWEISPTLIHRVQLRTVKQSFTFSFPSPAGSLSHLQLDPFMASYARQKGAQLLLSTKVKQIKPALTELEQHEIVLESEEVIQARHLLIATGRLSCLAHAPPPHMRYVGIKAHFQGIPLDQELEMFSFSQAYIGLSPIEESKCNIACLAHLDLFQKAGSAKALIDSLCIQNPLLKTYLSNGKNLFSDWMTAFLPEFGMKPSLSWPRTYFLGDAAGTIPPACGNGLTMALMGGQMAAHYALKNDPEGFKKEWTSRYRSKILAGKCLHQLMLHPAYGHFFLHLSSFFPSLPSLFFSWTR